MPDIIFEEMPLTVGVLPDLHVEKHTNLASGDSFTYEHRTRYGELGRIVFGVDSVVSPLSLLRAKRGASNVPSRAADLSIASYVAVLKASLFSFTSYLAPRASTLACTEAFMWPKSSPS